MTLYAAHPWLRDENTRLPLDVFPFKLVKSYFRATPLKRAALKVRTIVNDAHPLFVDLACHKLILLPSDINFKFASFRVKPHLTMNSSQYIRINLVMWD